MVRKPSSFSKELASSQWRLEGKLAIMPDGDEHSEEKTGPSEGLRWEECYFWVVRGGFPMAMTLNNDLNEVRE